MNDVSHPPRTGARRGQIDTLVALAIGPVFLLLAAWFVWGAGALDLPRAEPVPVNRADISAEPWRAPLTEPVLDVAGFDFSCIECHSLFRSKPDTPLRLNQHRNIVQAHGMNDRCFNCHDERDRGALVLPGGVLVSFAQSAQLCATCHGTTFRDWEMGMHGRTNGFWDSDKGPQIRLTCTQCHDPHAPAFGPMTALPGPNTLRLRRPDHDAGHEGGRRNPLRRWSSGGGVP